MIKKSQKIDYFDKIERKIKDKINIKDSRGFFKHSKKSKGLKSDQILSQKIQDNILDRKYLQRMERNTIIDSKFLKKKFKSKQSFEDNFKFPKIERVSHCNANDRILRQRKRMFKIDKSHLDAMNLLQNRFKMIQVLGKGNFATIYLALDLIEN